MCCPYVAMSWGYHTLVWSVDSQRNTHENVWKKGAVTLGNVSYILQQHCETRCGLHVTRCNVSSNPPKNRRLIRNGGGSRFTGCESTASRFTGCELPCRTSSFLSIECVFLRPHFRAAYVVKV